MDFSIFLSPWQHIPPTVMDNRFNAISVFIMPQSLLNEKLKIFLAFKDDTKPGRSSIPDEIYG
jgi:hypothetical protein